MDLTSKLPASAGTAASDTTPGMARFYGMNAASIEHRQVTEDDVYADAWRIADPGAVNPLAVARTLTDASRVIMRVHGSTDAVRTHPALRVIAGQLAMLYGVDSFGASIADYDATEKRARSLIAMEA